MSKFFQKPINLTFDDIEKYVNTCKISDEDMKLFEYLYLLCKKYCVDQKYGLDSDQIESFSLRCACSCFQFMQQNRCTFKEAIENLAYDIRVNLNLEKKELSKSNEFMFKNHLIDLLEYSKFNGYSDITNFTSFIDEFLRRLPKKVYSSEWYNLYISVLQSFYKTICISDKLIFNYFEDIKLDIVLYRLPSYYKSYVICIVSQLLNNLKDSFNSTTTVKSDTVYSLNLRELLQ